MATPAQLAEKAGMARPSPPSSTRPPPQLPPRANSVLSPPPYSPEEPKTDNMASVDWRTPDPRRLSTDSLHPLRSGSSRRRTLLLVYIHGFMGNEASFQSFPAHVHNLLTVSLSETHVVHTKMYPRYKSRKTIEFAREEFSSWLEPNTRYGTDIVLLGHSMGGLLAGEVALKPSRTPATGQPFYHRILGTVNFDTPFLGLHPGIISSGISSLFRPAPDSSSKDEEQSSATGLDTPSGSDQATQAFGGDGFSSPSLTRSLTSPLSTPSLKDPSFDPPFPNDVRVKERTAWSGFMHFVNKHSDNLTTAAKQYFMSHLEFGACLADYPGLKSRCDRLRALEDIDELAGLDNPGYRRPVRRIRFVNYYTSSTGRPKPPKRDAEEKTTSNEDGRPMEFEMQAMALDYPRSPSIPSGPTSPISAHFGDAMASVEQLSRRPTPSQMQTPRQDFQPPFKAEDDYEEPLKLQHIDAEPVEDDWIPAVADASKEPVSLSSEPPGEFDVTSLEPALPPIPGVPIQPDPIDLSLFTDKDTRKIAEKEHKRLMKVYQQAVKDRESAIKDRKKLAEKREKKARQDLEKQLKADENKRLKEEKEVEKRKGSLVPPTSPALQSPMAPLSPQPKAEGKAKKDRKFCLLPPKRGGKRDKCWVRVHMEGVDEVGAHCGLFFPGAQYENLVRDVGERVVTWVHEDAVRRIALEGYGGD